LQELRLLTVGEVVNLGAEEVGQLCGLKVGPKIRLGKALKRLDVSGGAASPSDLEPLSPELLAVIEA
jgi:hypothetical protein